MFGEFPASREDLDGLLQEIQPWVHDAHGDDGSLLDPPADGLVRLDPFELDEEHLSHDGHGDDGRLLEGEPYGC